MWLALALGMVVVAPVGAHLRNVGGSLLDLLVRGDALVLLEVASATTDQPPETRVRTARVFGGDAPPKEFALQSAPSPMRYAKGQRAVVAMQRDHGSWKAVQLAGEGLVFEDAEFDESTADYLAALWTATHEAEPGADLGQTLRRGLELPHRKLRLWAALDLAELAHHRPGLSASVRAEIERDLEDPDLDPAVRLALSRAVGRVPPP